MKCVTVRTNNHIQDFLKLPDLLYQTNNNTRDKKLEKQILTGKHILSKYFTATGLLVYNGSGMIMGRCIVTIYKNNGNGEAYFGFFDAINSTKAARLLVGKAEEIAKKHGKIKLVGPLDGSFWLGYRLKIDESHDIYTGEPYNNPYYLRILSKTGLKISERYISNRYRVPTEKDNNTKYIRRLDKLKENGYTVENACFWKFNRQLRDIFKLLCKLYSTFPCYKPITEKEFCKMFSKLRYVLDYNMVFLVYREKTLKGFMVNVPDYGPKVGLLKLIFKRFNRYVLLYMGADQDALGLGSALAELTKRGLCERKCESIGALIHEGKVTGILYKDLIEYKYEYVLLSKNIG